MRRLTSLAVASLALLAACSGSTGGTPPAAHPSSPAVAPAVPPDAVVTVRARADRRADVELRSAADGRLLSVLLPSLPVEVGLARLSPGALLLSTPDGCRTVLERLDLASRVRTPLRVLDRPAHGVTPSPDGRSVAFLTTPSCSSPSSPARPSTGAAGYLPNVVAVTGVAGGPVRSTATDTPGHPLSGITWSPEGATIATTYLGDAGEQLLLLDATAPRFRTARRAPATRGCHLAALVWPRGGLLATERCGSAADRGGVGRLVRLTPVGRVSAAWPLPACMYSLEAATVPTGAGLVMVEHSGYGQGACGRRRHWADQLATLDVSRAGTSPTVLRTLPLRFMSPELSLVG